MDYKNGKIYQILNKLNEEVYVGSTTQPLCKRPYTHKQHSTYRVECKAPLYELMKYIGNKHFYIELIELVPCNSKEELTAREGYYIRERSTLNKVINGRTYKEWYNGNQGRIKQYQQQYKEDNREHILQQKKEYYKCSKDQLLQTKKQYYENNPEKKSN